METLALTVTVPPEDMSFCRKTVRLHRVQNENFYFLPESVVIENLEAERQAILDQSGYEMIRCSRGTEARVENPGYNAFPSCRNRDRRSALPEFLFEAN